ncbi:hypothetical protein OCA5_c23650 [Afipia carboxidovorans OM5]|uniref:Uncharacterized protein n=1 Tax=Afipia carboxidovorans (strain ATCC 49405 / DSM 1227 / KCTC 32145 / OM5) TaxID=504832 RepID=F8BZZ7_AFIC5|nr:hypothetical protein [Afipia carboxidovorans]AEI03485.1 hypothetical protein OCA4_c23640 [Afipia carboxidovorans OM4]AEI07062.1 hypothetical protein OCA5_c23650 [Afipia carboxidovorans OM5]
MRKVVPMRLRILASLAVLVGSTACAVADSGGAFAIPGKAGVPVVINGRIASFAMVEGDWGLARGVHVQPTVYGGWDRYERPPVGHYYPSLGRRPGYGRLEVEPPANRKLPQPAESYHQSWSARSAPPAPPPAAVPMDPPAVIVAPRPYQEFRN